MRRFVDTVLHFLDARKTCCCRRVAYASVARQPICETNAPSANLRDETALSQRNKMPLSGIQGGRMPVTFCDLLHDSIRLLVNLVAR